MSVVLNSLPLPQNYYCLDGNLLTVTFFYNSIGHEWSAQGPGSASIRNSFHSVNGPVNYHRSCSLELPVLPTHTQPQSRYKTRSIPCLNNIFILRNT